MIRVNGVRDERKGFTLRSRFSTAGETNRGEYEGGLRGSMCPWTTKVRPGQKGSEGRTSLRGRTQGRGTGVRFGFRRDRVLVSLY